MIGIIPDVIKNNLCEFEVFRGMRRHIVDVGQHLLFLSIGWQNEYASRSGMSILGQQWGWFKF